MKVSTLIVEEADTDLREIEMTDRAAPMDETPESWLAALFEFEFCAECGGDAEDHEVCVVPGLGTYFARCLHPYEPQAAVCQSPDGPQEGRHPARCSSSSTPTAG